MVSITFVTSPMGASIYIDSVNTDTITPNTLDLSEGEHSYMLKLTGFEDVTDVITLVAGNIYRVDVTMKETSIQQSQTFNEKLLFLGWAGILVALAGLLLSLRKKGG